MIHPSKIVATNDARARRGVKNLDPHQERLAAIDAYRERLDPATVARLTPRPRIMAGNDAGKKENSLDFRQLGMLIGTVVFMAAMFYEGLIYFAHHPPTHEIFDCARALETSTGVCREMWREENPRPFNYPLVLAFAIMIAGQALANALMLIFSKPVPPLPQTGEQQEAIVSILHMRITQLATAEATPETIPTTAERWKAKATAVLERIPQPENPRRYAIAGMSGVLMLVLFLAPSALSPQPSTAQHSPAAELVQELDNGSQPEPTPYTLRRVADIDQPPKICEVRTASGTTWTICENLDNP